MPNHDLALPQALRPRQTDEVLSQRFEHRRARVPGDACRRADAEDNRREDEVGCDVSWVPPARLRRPDPAGWQPAEPHGEDADECQCYPEVGYREPEEREQ